MSCRRDTILNCDHIWETGLAFILPNPQSSACFQLCVLSKFIDIGPIHPSRSTYSSACLPVKPTQLQDVCLCDLVWVFEYYGEESHFLSLSLPHTTPPPQSIPSPGQPPSRPSRPSHRHRRHMKKWVFCCTEKTSGAHSVSRVVWPFNTVTLWGEYCDAFLLMSYFYPLWC